MYKLTLFYCLYTCLRCLNSFFMWFIRSILHQNFTEINLFFNLCGLFYTSFFCFFYLYCNCYLYKNNCYLYKFYVI